MQFTIDSNTLASAAGYVAKVISARPTNPLLAGILLSVSDGKVTLYATDSTSSATAQAHVDAQVTHEGIALVNGKQIAEIASAVRGDLEVTLDERVVRLRAGKAKFALPTMDPAAYPASTPAPAEVTGTVPTDELLAAVDTVTIASDPNNPMPILGAVYMEFARDKITLAATDRYRLASRTVSWSSKAKQPTVMLIQAKALHDAVRGLAKDGETVSISMVGSDQLVLSGKTRTARVTATDAEYPAWRALLPKSHTGAAVVSAKSALEVIHRVSLVGQGNDPVSIRFTADRLFVSCGRPDAAGGSDEIFAEYTGEEMTALFAPEYLRQGLVACGDQDVVIHLVHPNKPAVITPQDGSPYSYLVMTVRPTVALAA